MNSAVARLQNNSTMTGGVVFVYTSKIADLDRLIARKIDVIVFAVPQTQHPPVPL